jgi:hypothetical protein
VLLFSPEGKSDGRPQDVNISEEEEEKFTRRFFLSFFCRTPNRVLEFLSPPLPIINIHQGAAACVTVETSVVCV